MRVLLTGASSFTGSWIARELLARGIEVVAPLCRGLEEGEPLRLRRLRGLGRGCRLVGEAGMGTDRLLAVATEEAFDLLWLHGAAVGDFRAPHYDPLVAAAAGTAGAGELMDASGCAGVIVTGSVFEADEGRADGDAGAIGAYGLAKTLAWQMLRFSAERRGLALTKLVIPHPFGPLEKPGLTTALLDAWATGRPAILRQPAMVRDFIPVTWLARTAGDLVQTPPCRRPARLAPSAFPLPVADFAASLAEAVRARVALSCRIEQVPEPVREPLLRVGRDRVPEADDPTACEQVWDEYLHGYINQ